MDIYIEEYLQYMQTEHRASGNTLQAYRSDLTKLGNFLGNNGIYDWNKVTIINLNSYILALEKNGTAASTVSRNISSIKSFLPGCSDADLLMMNLLFTLSTRGLSLRARILLNQANWTGFFGYRYEHSQGSAR